MTAAISYFITGCSAFVLLALWFYIETLLKPTFRFPGPLMGRRKVEDTGGSKEKDPVIYICEECGFVFYGAGEIRECPYCGKQRVHDSSGEDVETLRPFLEQQKTECLYDQKPVDI